MAKFNMIAATSNNNVIGKNNELPWLITKDLQHFKEITKGHNIVMGWNTWVSIGEKPLPGRINWVISRKKRQVPRSKYVKLIHNPLQLVHEKGLFFVIGGEPIFQLFLPVTQQLFLTRVYIDVDFDNKDKVALFPTNLHQHFKLNCTSEIMEENGIEFAFTEWLRKVPLEPYE